MYTTWSSDLPPADAAREERALTFDQGRERRVLVLAPLFSEHNTMRHQLVEIMRRLDGAGIDSTLPDLPGCGESMALLKDQTLSGWRRAMAGYARTFGTTEVFAVRGGTALLPDEIPAFVYGAVDASKILRTMIRARSIASREAGRTERIDEILERGRRDGVELAGYRLGPDMVRELDEAVLELPRRARIIDQVEIGGSPLWLQAEPADDPEQADALAALIAVSPQLS